MQPDVPDALWLGGRRCGKRRGFRGYENHRQLSEQIKNAWAAADTLAPRFDLILYEQFFFLGKHLAEKHRKPAVRIFTAPVTNKALMTEFITAKGPFSILGINGSPEPLRRTLQRASS